MLMVMDKDGNAIKHYNECVEWSNKETPYQNCCTPWFPCWMVFSCITPKKLEEKMVPHNNNQIVQLNKQKKTVQLNKQRHYNRIFRPRFTKMGHQMNPKMANSQKSVLCLSRQK
eukprot:7150627-Ditylum_brightwellii.AAC.1